jgi:hypothetical protein
MPSLLRMCDQKEVSKYNLLTASYLDQNLSTLEGCEAYGSNPLAGMSAVNYDASIMLRGVIVPEIVITQMISAGVVEALVLYVLLLVIYSKYQYPFLKLSLYCSYLHLLD